MLRFNVFWVVFLLLFPSASYADAPTHILTDMNKELGQYISDNVSSYASTVSLIFIPLMGACFGLYFVYKWGMMHYRGCPTAFEDMLINGLKLLIIMTGLGASGWYISHVVPFVMNVGDEVAAKIISNDGSALSGIETLIVQINSTVGHLIDLNMSFKWLDMNFKTLIIAGFNVLLLFVGGSLFITYATGILMVAKFMVALLLIIGPLYLMLAMYEQTVSFSKQWIGQAFNYILLNVFVTLSIHILLGFMNRHFDQNTTYDLSTSFYYFIILALGFFIIGQVPTFVSSITGGVGINGLVGAVNQTGGMLFNTGKFAAKAGMKGASKTASTVKKGLDALRGNIRGG